MAEIQDVYSYHPVSENEVRLCRFLDDSDCVSAELRIFSIDTLPRYQTVSYVWSLNGLEPTRNWSLKVDGLQIPILDTLRPFIQTLRNKMSLLDETWWWIDSLCIDLANNAERSLQVQLMHRLYSMCRKCIVWLGEGSESSERGIDFIHLLHRTSQSTRNVKHIRLALQSEEHRASWTFLEEFLARKWWTRVWTVPEFVLPSMVSFWCGLRTVSRTMLCASLSIADQGISHGFNDSTSFRQAWNRRRVWLWHKQLSKAPGVHAGLSLPTLAAYCCTNKASNDIDRLYGLHSLSATDRELLEVDYSRSVDQVYSQFTMSFIEKHASLDIMIFASIFSSPANSLLPSWVPDWRSAPPCGLLVVPLMVSQSSNTALGNLRPPRVLRCNKPLVCYTASGNRPAMYAFDGPTLCVRGIDIDRSGPCIGDQELGLAATIKLPTAHATCSPRDILISVCRCLVLGRHDRYLRFAMPTEEFLEDFLGLCYLSMMDPGAVQPAFLEWFDRTRHLQIHSLSLEATIQQYLEQIEPIPLRRSPGQDQYLQDSFFGRFYDIVVRMSLRLTVTRNGRVGMVPEKARPDDVVCILYGCSVPVLLRRVGDDDAYTLVGECYVDQCMSGEALDSDYQETTFRIQ